jgi:hypothetical protein
MSYHDPETPSRLAAQRPAEEAAETGVRRAAVERDPVDRVSCRLGDASCATAHAAALDPSHRVEPSSARSALLRLQRQFGNRYVGQVLDRARDGDAGSESGGGGLDAVERSIDQARGAGQGLDHGTRHEMESAFGADFGGVRIHTDARADDLNHALSARAFATGKDVFFRQGEYAPGTSSGRELLAHELTHVVQQTGDGIRAKLTVSEPNDPHEIEADQMARAVVRQENAPSGQQQASRREDEEEQPAAAKRVAPSLQRQPEAPKPEDEEEKKKLHAKRDASRGSRQADDQAPPLG